MHIGPHIGPGRRIGGIFVPPAGSGFYADYTRGRYATGGVPEAFAAKHTFTRTGVADWLNAAGDGLNPQVASNVPRIDGRGYLAEAQVENKVKNTVLAGAVVGAPGTFPTGFSVFANNGLATHVIDKDTNYVTLRIFGLTTGTFYVLALDGAAAIAASPGETWASQCSYQLMPGGTGIANISTFTHQVRASNNIDKAFTPTTTMQRITARGIAAAGTVFAVPALTLTFASGVNIDMYLKIRLPTANLGDQTSPILTSGAALTRNADQLTAAISGISAGGDWTIAGQFVMPETADNGNEALFGFIVDGNNRWSIRRNAGNFIAYIPVVGGVGGTAVNIVAPALGSVYGIALNRVGADIRMSINGGAVTSVTPASLPAGAPTSLGVANNGISGQSLNGRVQKVVVFPTAKNNAELQALATIGGIS